MEIYPPGFIERQIGSHIQLKHPDFKIKLQYTSK